MAIPCTWLVPDQHPVRAQLMAAGAPLGRKHHPAALGAWDDITNAGHGVQDRADLAAANKRRSDLRVQSNIWSIGFRWAETLDGAGAAFAPAAAAAIVAFQIRDSPAWAGSVSSPLRCWWARKQGVQTRWSGSRRDSGGALGTLCTPALSCGPTPSPRTSRWKRLRRCRFGPSAQTQLVCLLWLSDSGRRCASHKATASASLRAQGSHRPRAVLAMLARETDAPGPCTPRPSCRPKSPLPEGKQNRRPRARLPRKVQS